MSRFIVQTCLSSMDEQVGQLCAQCKDKPAIYKCPGCSRRTCSSICSAAHKTAYNCDGIRKKSAFVPMNKYTWGSMMDDYVYLEECGRQITDWANDIAANRLARSKSHPHRRTKRSSLQSHLESFDIYMELAPIGMQRQSLNKSTWKQK